MHFSFVRQFLAGILLVGSLLLLSGCNMKLTNMTAPSLAENPSQIYTLSLRVSGSSANIVEGSLSPYVVIGGKNYKMDKSPLGKDLYELDFQLPAGQDVMKYYYLVQYKVNSNGYTITREAYTNMQESRIARRYVVTLEVGRGPVGSKVSVLGRGFTPQDIVYLDGIPARTVFDSSNSLSFFVPSVDTGRSYGVKIMNGGGETPVGSFRVDPSAVTVSPSSLDLRSGEKQFLTFTLPLPATQGGLLLDVTTDVPDSVIMPEVLVPEGESSVTIPVQGGRKGSGILYLKGFGAGEITIPVTVR